MYSNGDKYEGSLINDLYEGEGVFTYANGEIKRGVWKNGNFIG